MNDSLYQNFKYEFLKEHEFEKANKPEFINIWWLLTQGLNKYLLKKN